MHYQVHRPINGVLRYGNPNVLVWRRQVCVLTHGAATNRAHRFEKLSSTGGPVSTSFGAPSRSTRPLLMTGCIAWAGAIQGVPKVQACCWAPWTRPSTRSGKARGPIRHDHQRGARNGAGGARPVRCRSALDGGHTGAMRVSRLTQRRVSTFASPFGSAGIAFRDPKVLA